ncbi:NAD(P)H-binding protein [Candidatus Enterococcus murrayae]|uniref:NAD(P)H-binding protein n=1 Tax=Candidatus Enterococcus murrayae TaxID=2815321 RepID=A0ABS3HAZ7_9ENTE|nr:NAD(P)H-binding protein [Enterococcus sp. MJM16]MBO0450634.1 NAD(P)H-binding protein [Enterococcus sp. MJM16]
MKLFIAGATGRVGEELIKNLVENGHYVYAGARHDETIEAKEAVKPVHLDLHGSVAEIADTLADAEAVYFVAGSRGKDLLQTDLYGAVKLMQAAEQKGIKRYIHLSSLFALQPEKWSSTLTDYNISKFFSDRWLIDKTNLDYTILQPGSLMETPGSGKITTDITGKSENSIENVAAVLAEMLEQDNTIKKVVLMGDGEIPIEEAIKNI